MNARCTCSDNKRECDCGIKTHGVLFRFAMSFAADPIASAAVALALVVACIALAFLIPIGAYQ